MNHLECVTSKRNKWYWYLLVLFLCIVASNIIGAIPVVFFVILGIIIKNGANAETVQSMSEMDSSSVGIGKSLGLSVIGFSFVVLLVAAIILIKSIHGRTWKEVINGTNKVRWPRFFFGFAIWSIIAVIAFFLDFYFNRDDIVFQSFNPIGFIVLVIVSLIFIPIQSSSEEFLFRGYLAQGVASWTKSRWLAMLVPGILFGLMHSANPEVFKYGFAIMMAQYILTGLIFGFISVCDDGIELSMGIHSANNILSSVLVTYENSAIQTDALFKYKEINPNADLISLIVVGIVIVLIFAYKYKWNFRILNQKVELKQM